jgi:pimeloyl-ACP methyl ester carboxylesterase
LHGYAGNFLVYCWEVAQAASAAGLLTICPSETADAGWWTKQGEQTYVRTVRQLRAMGIRRIYLAGLSNGAAGASVIASRHGAELSGLILISGVRAAQPPSLPTLVIQGSRDRMMVASRARAYAARGAGARYEEVPGGHLIFLSRHERVRALIAGFLSQSLRSSS